MENPLHDRALVGGLDSDGSKIFIGRALINQSYFPVNIVPSRKKAYICEGFYNIFENIFKLFFQLVAVGQSKLNAFNTSLMMRILENFHGNQLMVAKLLMVL